MTDLTADAGNRAWRTLLQGFATTAGLVVVSLVSRALTTAGDLRVVDWPSLGWAVAFAVVMAGVSFVWRKVLDQSGIPSAVPPDV